VVEVKSESSQGTHSAPFPRALVEFFLLAFSDTGDVVFDPFMGSGTTLAAAALLDRVAYGCEISPGYCDVILRRLMNLIGKTPVLESTGDTFVAVAEARGVALDQPLASGPKQHDGRKRKAS
jgi:DNA modification methylase